MAALIACVEGCDMHGAHACRAVPLMGSNKNAATTHRRAEELRTLCREGLEQLPAWQKQRHLSVGKIAWCAL